MKTLYERLFVRAGARSRRSKCGRGRGKRRCTGVSHASHPVLRPPDPATRRSAQAFLCFISHFLREIKHRTILDCVRTVALLVKAAEEALSDEDESPVAMAEAKRQQRQRSTQSGAAGAPSRSSGFK